MGGEVSRVLRFGSVSGLVSEGSFVCKDGVFFIEMGRVVEGVGLGEN